MRISRDAKTVRTHNAVSVAGNGTSLQGEGANFIDCDGYSDISITFSNDAALTSSADIYWSNDNTSLHGADFGVAPSSTVQQKAGTTKVKARYAKVRVVNGDAAAHTMSAWAYLTT